MNADHTVHKHVGNITISNGMDWTNDNRTMYYIDSISRQIMAFNFDMNAGKISNKRVVTEFGSKDNSDLRFSDGMAIDMEGKLCVAGYDDGKIIRVDPATGKVIRTVNFPVKRITSCCIGGKDFADLYVTTSTFHMGPEDIKKSPLAGSIFKGQHRLSDSTPVNTGQRVDRKKTSVVTYFADSNSYFVCHGHDIAEHYITYDPEMSETVEVLVKNTAQMGEGPHWDEVSQCLYYVDLFVGDVCRYNTVTAETSRLHIGDKRVSIIIPRQTGGFVVSQGGDVAIIESWNSEAIRTIAKVEEDDTCVLNDGKVDACGRLWIGSYFNGKGIPSMWPKGRGSLYSLDTDGKVRKNKDNITISNGMDWSNDNQTMYYIDSTPRQVWAFDFEITTGTITKQRTLADFSGTSPSDMGYPDGMTVDSEGKLWIACCGASKVVRVDQETGQVIRTVKFPAANISSCCFGGKDYSDLYVTSLASPDDKNNITSAGSVFRVTGLEIKGRKPNVFPG